MCACNAQTACTVIKLPGALHCHPLSAPTRTAPRPAASLVIKLRQHQPFILRVTWPDLQLHGHQLTLVSSWLFNCLAKAVIVLPHNYFSSFFPIFWRKKSQTVKNRPRRWFIRLALHQSCVRYLYRMSLNDFSNFFTLNLKKNRMTDFLFDYADSF